MLEYQGEPCIMCGRTFTEEDDIVVCPECGTPYHRACWKEQGACINTVLHETGQSWMEQHKEVLRERRRTEKRIEEEEQAAERERDGGSRDGMASLLDGVRINPNDPTVGLDPDEDFEGVPLGSLAEFVASNRLYYLPMFRFMKKTGRKITFNLSGLLFADLFFAHRKMWGAALLTFFVNLMLSIPYLIVNMISYYNVTISWADPSTPEFANIYRLCAGGELALNVFLFLFANYLYYRHALRKVRSIRRQNGAKEVLQREGGTSVLNIVLMLIIKVAGLACMLMILAMI